MSSKLHSYSETPSAKLRAAVVARVTELQSKATDETKRHPDVAGRLARLRRAVKAEPGSAPDIWSDTIGSIPEQLWGSGQETSSWERAAHTAITLFAVHAQGSAAAVHKQGISLGRAVRRLAGARSQDISGQDPAIFKRFQALATAVAGEELNHHLRSMITLLRSEGIQLDYGQLAVDIRDLGSPRSADRVRLRWGRDYHRIPTEPTVTGTEATDVRLTTEEKP